MCCTLESTRSTTTLKIYNLLSSLPEFNGALSQRDSELLLSYLTVPYIRLPLVLNFFAQEDRVHALRSSDLRR